MGRLFSCLSPQGVGGRVGVEGGGVEGGEPGALRPVRCKACGAYGLLVDSPPPQPAIG